jgi:6-phosphofructokinase 2
VAAIVTLTLNPAIDGACEADAVRPTRKVRTKYDRYNAGGGGINIARVVQRLGGDVRAVYLAGGATGIVLDELLDADGIERMRIQIAGHTRISLNVFERASGQEYRFAPDGPMVSAAEIDACRAGCRGFLCGADRPIVRARHCGQFRPRAKGSGLGRVYLSD